MGVRRGGFGGLVGVDVWGGERATWPKPRKGWRNGDGDWGWGRGREECSGGRGRGSRTAERFVALPVLAVTEICRLITYVTTPRDHDR
jgi:hypothetical protein